ncbi:MAG: ABC transporter ATP-binding protein [Saprospiraceae bacterium]|jgi:subfamily B ATP-binding cassette protein MsbA
MNRSLWQLLGYLRNYKLLLSFNILSNILTAIFTALSIPLLVPFLEILFDRTEPVLSPPEQILSVEGMVQYAKYFLSQQIEENGKGDALAIVCIGILLVFFLKNLFRYSALFFMAPVRNGIIRDLRQQLFAKILILPLRFFSEEKKGDLLSRMTADVQEVESSILNVFESIFREPIVIAGALGFMIYVSPELTLFVFGLLFFTGIVIGGIGKTLKKSSSKVQEYLGNLVSIVEETLGGLRIIKAFGAEYYTQEKFGAENNQYRRLLTRLLWRRDLASPLSEFMGIATVSLLLWYGSREVFSGGLDAETFLTFIFAFYNVIDPAKSFSKASYNVQKGLGALHRIETILASDEKIPESTHPESLIAFKGNITYDNVSFQYQPDQAKILDGVSLSIPPGHTLALVGASGAGKSTLVDLLPRFYDPQEGQITLDGIPIKNLSLRELRSKMGIVSQDAILFNDTIFNNIVLEHTEIPLEKVIVAAKAANAHEFISQMPNGYQTNVGDRGSKLSGGQKQRITIARALLKNPPILIFDEATSALDAESEKLVQEALLRLMENRTSIIIAHRLSTIQHADEIAVLNKGMIVERGTHEELLEIDGHYKKLFELQAF